MSEINEKTETVTEPAPASSDSLDSWIALAVALVATFMAVCNIKDGNIVQTMGQLQAKSASKWSQYQSKSTKQNLTETTAVLAEMQKAPESVVQHYKDEVLRYDAEKKAIAVEAKGLEAEYEHLNIYDDQFDMSEAFLSVALAIFGIAALTKKRSLLIFGGLMSTLGVLLGMAGFLKMAFHPEWLAKLLG